MFYDCIVSSPEIAEQAKGILRDWKEEHGLYYARHVVRRPYGANYQFEASCGFRAIPNGGTWLTSGNNFHSITIDNSSTRITFAGRRHGMRSEFRDLLEAAARRSDYRTLTYQTEEPAWLPWETQDDQVSDVARDL
jgi:hypothetical protein